MTQCCHHLHESTNKLVASHSRVSVLVLFCVRVLVLFRVPLLFAWLMTMTAYWTMYRSFTSSLLWPSIIDGLEYYWEVHFARLLFLTF